MTGSLPDMFGMTQEQIDKINQKREEFVEEIRKVKSFNLEALESKVFDQDQEFDLNPEQLFTKFCFSITDPKANIPELDFIDIYFGYLIICDKYVSKEILNIFRILTREIKGKNKCPFLTVND